MSRPPPPVRSAFRRFLSIPTRWSDNDVYGHVNNTVYYGWFDTAVNRMLTDTGLLEIETAPVIGLVVETGCRYFAPVAFPEPVTVGLAVAHVGTSSVRYELGVFRAAPGSESEAALAAGHFIHVYVDRQTRRPVPLDERFRAVLGELAVAP